MKQINFHVIKRFKSRLICYYFSVKHFELPLCMKFATAIIYNIYKNIYINDLYLSLFYINLNN